MSDLLHWHGNPSQFVEPPECCQSAARRDRDRAVDEATYREAKRVITSGVERLNAYEDAILTVLGGEEQQKLVRTIVKQCREAIAAAACICPRIDVSTYGDAEPTYVPGRSELCGVHGQGMSR